MPRGESETSANRLTAAERRQKAVELRKGGATYVQIARELGCTKQAANKMVRKQLAELSKMADGDADELRQLELDRLDAMQLGLWDRARRGHEGAVDRVLRIMQRRSSLCGLDAPAKKEVTGKDGEPLPTGVLVISADDLKGMSDEELDALHRVAKRRSVDSGPQHRND